MKILLNFRFLIDPLFNNAVLTSCYCVERVLGNKNVRLNFEKLHVVRVSFFSQSINRALRNKTVKKSPFRMCDLNSFKNALQKLHCFPGQLCKNASLLVHRCYIIAHKVVMQHFIVINDSANLYRCVLGIIATLLTISYRIIPEVIGCNAKNFKSEITTIVSART